MRAGSVIVDLAVERGGNVEGARGPAVPRTRSGREDRRLPQRAGAARGLSASALYARNLLTFVDTLVDKKAKTLAVNWDDEIVKATSLTRDGAVVHPSFQPKSAA